MRSEILPSKLLRMEQGKNSVLWNFFNIDNCMVRKILDLATAG